MKLDIKYQNILTVDGSILPASTSSEYFSGVMTEALTLIRHAIREMYWRQSTHNPNIVRGSIRVMHLGKPIEELVTPEAIEEDRHAQYNRGVFVGRKIMSNLVQPYADSIIRYGLIPEIRTFSSGDSPEQYLLARDTAYDENGQQIPARLLNF